MLPMALSIYTVYAEVVAILILRRLYVAFLPGLLRNIITPAPVRRQYVLFSKIERRAYVVRSEKLLK